LLNEHARQFARISGIAERLGGILEEPRDRYRWLLEGAAFLAARVNSSKHEFPEFTENLAGHSVRITSRQRLR